MTENDIVEIGSAYVRACRHKALVHRLASQTAGKKLEVEALSSAQVAELDQVDALTIGVMLLLDWGADVPPELMARAHLAQSFRLPGSLEIH